MESISSLASLTLLKTTKQNKTIVYILFPLVQNNKSILKFKTNDNKY